MVQVTDLEHQASCRPCGAFAGRQEVIPEYKRLMIEFVKILDDVPIDDQLQLKLMILADCRKWCPQFLVPMTAVFLAAEHRQPLLIEMRGRELPAAPSAAITEN